MKRRSVLKSIGIAAVARFMSGMKPNLALASLTGSQSANQTDEQLRPFHVEVPAHAEALPFGSDRSGSKPAFELRGIKGWAWSTELS
jgi:hypothetical protein